MESSNSDILNRLNKLENSDSQPTNIDNYNEVSELEKKIEFIDITQRCMNLIFTKLPEPHICLIMNKH